ncbi:hypothetical protein, partial [Achromobacter xylosoxidans]|uniref:hypothetical protein n=2 Tax=Alcaligenaceae TaxID=506 RepID=UPI001E468BD2
ASPRTAAAAPRARMRNRECNDMESSGKKSLDPGIVPQRRRDAAKGLGRAMAMASRHGATLDASIETPHDGA